MLVVALGIAAVVALVRDAGPGPGAPVMDGAGPGVADAGVAAGAVPSAVPEPDDATARGPIATTTRRLPVPGCEERARRRLERSREFDLTRIGQNAVAILQESGDTEHLLAAALMSTDRTVIQELLDRVLIADPANRVAHWKNLENCHARGSDCDRRAVEAAALAVDGANGLVWIGIASALMGDERWDEAELALRRAAVAPRFDSYFMEFALLIERGLAATSEMDYTERMVAGFGYSAATAIPGYSQMTRRCTGEADGYLLPADTCFELGEQMARYGTELLAVLIGMSVKRHAASRLGNEELARKLESDTRRIRDGVLQERVDSGAQALLQNDAALLRRYVDTFVAHGEIRATEALVAEARRLREDPGYDPCNFVGNPAFRPEPEVP